MFNGLDLLYCISIAFSLMYIVILSRRISLIERYLTGEDNDEDQTV